MYCIHISGHIWGRSLVKLQNVDDPCNFGWKKNSDDVWVPIWTHYEPAMKSNINKNCGCSMSACRGNCICRKLKMNCTSLSKCEAKCEQAVHS